MVTARDLHQERAPDYRQILIAAEDGRILVTHNEADFFLLHGAWLVWPAAWQVPSPPRHSGIVIIPHWTPMLPGWAPAGAAQELSDFLQGRSSLSNELYIWRRGTGWQLHRP